MNVWMGKIIVSRILVVGGILNAGDAMNTV